MASGLLDIEEVLANCSLQRLAKRTQLVESTTSTNDVIWEQAAGGASDGLVVFAEHQTAGRGRMGRAWHSPRGASVMASVLLIDAPNHSVPPVGTLSLIAGIATARAVREACDLNARIDWPNDVVIGNRKLAGTLVESRVLDGGRRAYVVGIGINCLQHRDHFPKELRSLATSLEIECDHPVCRETVAGALLSHLDAWLVDPDLWDAQTVCDAFRACALPNGRRVRVRYEGEVYEGEVVEVDPSAALVVLLDDGVRTVFAAARTTVIKDWDTGD